MLPLSGLFEVSPLCNFSCKMCYVRKTREEVSALGGLHDGDWWIELARQAGALGMLYPLLSGGETFAYPEFEKVYLALEQMGMMVTINSNGSLITEKRARWLEEHRPMRINITLYGAGPESYERLCGSGAAFERVMDGVHRLKAHNIPVKFNCSVTPQNVGDLAEMIAIAQREEIPMQVATYMFPAVRREADSFGENNRLSPREAARAHFLRAKLQMRPEALHAMALRFSRFTPLYQIDFDALEPGAGRPMRCYAGKNAFWVDWQGNLSACGMMGIDAVSLTDCTFAEGWRQVVEHTDSLRYGAVCMACPNCMICNTCQANVYLETGTAHGRPTYFCEMMEAVAEEYRAELKECPSNSEVILKLEDEPEVCGL